MKTILRKIRNIKGAIIALKKKGEQGMTEIICPQCHNVTSAGIIRVNCEGNAKMWGIIQCLACQHEFPFTMFRNYMEKLDIALPGLQSDKLNSSVPADIREDIKEAERANYSQCYKATATMCRRAVQLGLIDKGIPEAPFGAMLKKALSQNILSQDLYNLATSIKGFGDIGAHRREHLEPQEVNMLIYATVRMLNELFQ